MTAIPKLRPRLLDRRDSKRNEDAYFKEQRALAFARDGNRCRVCGAGFRLEPHHVERRSHFGPKRVVEKHHKSNLYTCCSECHELFTGNVLKAVSLTAKGTDGPVQITRYSDAEQDWTIFKAKA
jgi:hypothetical protein